MSKREHQGAKAGAGKTSSGQAKVDVAVLNKVAAAMVSDPSLSLSAAIKKSGAKDAATTRRIQQLWAAEGETRLAEARLAELNQAEARQARAKADEIKAVEVKAPEAKAPEAKVEVKAEAKPVEIKPVEAEPVALAETAEVKPLRTKKPAAEPVAEAFAPPPPANDVRPPLRAVAAAAKADETAVEAVPEAVAAAPVSDEVREEPVAIAAFDEAAPEAPAEDVQPVSIVQESVKGVVATIELAALPYMEQALAISAAAPSEPAAIVPVESLFAAAPKASHTGSVPRFPAPLDLFGVFGLFQMVEHAFAQWKLINDFACTTFIRNVEQAVRVRRSLDIWSAWR